MCVGGGGWEGGGAAGCVCVWGGATIRSKNKISKLRLFKLCS